MMADAELRPMSGKIISLAPGKWQRGPDGHVTIYCQRCSVPLLLTDRSQPHIVDVDGLVHPSVGCRQCGWHEFVHLEGWDGARPAQAH